MVVLRNLIGFWLFGFSNSILGLILFYTSMYSEINTHLLYSVPVCLLKLLPLFLSGYLRSQVIVLSSLHILSSVVFALAYYFSLDQLVHLSLLFTLLATGFAEVFFISYSSRFNR